MRRISPFLSLVAAFACVLVATPDTARAQSLGLWGGWDENGSWQGTEPKRRPPQQPYSGGSFFGFGPGPGEPFPSIMDGGPRPAVVGRAPPIVAFPNAEKAGTVIIDNAARRLYLVLDEDEAYAYPISVGRDGFTWTGTETISRIADWPDWHPPQEMRARDPRLPEKMYGGIKNPLGAKALFLGNSLYRIHGTNDPKTIGYAASSGCFRMMNDHVVHLAALVEVGTVVKVMDHLPDPDDLASLPWTATAKPAAFGTGRRPAAD
jgi:lipoprotein-anchoring transpeptidase ErfK/SrfK